MKYYIIEMEDYGTNTPGKILSKWIYTNESKAKEIFESILKEQEFDQSEDGDTRGEGQANEWSDYPNNYKIIYWANSRDCSYYLELQEIDM